MLQTLVHQEMRGVGQRGNSFGLGPQQFAHEAILGWDHQGPLGPTTGQVLGRAASSLGFYPEPKPGQSSYRLARAPERLRCLLLNGPGRACSASISSSVSCRAMKTSAMITTRTPTTRRPIPTGLLNDSTSRPR
jgi:hypothetical protein